jgi:hypothetical protein
MAGDGPQSLAAFPWLIPLPARPMSDDVNINEPKPTSTARAPYATPRLQTFGTVAALTRNVGMMGLLADKTGGGSNKTM